jgi:phosphopantothenate synthetase
MTDEQILELARKHLDEFPDDFTATKEQLIEFAQQIHKQTLEEVISVLQNVPNPEANRAAINRIELELNR